MFKGTKKERRKQENRKLKNNQINKNNRGIAFVHILQLRLKNYQSHTNVFVILEATFFNVKCTY